MKADGKKTKRFITDLFFLVIACCVGAFATTAVMLPNGLTSGGLTGIVRILQTFIPMDFSVMYYALAILIWVVVVALLGMEEGRKVLVVTLLYPAILVVFEQINFQLLEEKDVILAAIFCGVFAGVCNGLVFWRGYSFCGTESVAKILKKKLLPHVDISKILLLLDSVIIILSAFIFGRNIDLEGASDARSEEKIRGITLHGAYMDDECVCQLAESGAVWTPTAVTIGNLIGCGRYPDTVLEPLLELHLKNIAACHAQGGIVAAGSDAGAYLVPHGKGSFDEYALMRRAGVTDAAMEAAMEHVRLRFRRAV